MGIFKNWLEYGVTGSATNPKRTAEKWWHSIPTTKYIDEGLIDRIARGAANSQLNAKLYVARQLHLSGQGPKPKQIKIFKQKIDGTLLKNIPPEFKKRELDEASIFVQAEYRPTFVFGAYADGEKLIGEIIILLIPMPYYPDDVPALAAAIMHETQHAEDFLLGKLATKRNVDVQMTMDEYLESEDEARAFTRQVMSLLAALQHSYQLPWNEVTDKIVDIIENSHGGGGKYATEVVREFMRIINRPTANEGVATMPRTSEQQLLTQIATKFVQQVNKRPARKFLTELGRQKGVDFYK